MVDFAKGEHRQPQFLKLNLKFPPCP
jgi:hypothetical protein